VGRLLRVYADIVNDMEEAGYSEDQTEIITKEVTHFEQVRTEVRLASGDHIDLRKYEPAMRALMDRYISADESEKLTSFDDKSLVELLVDKGIDALAGLPEAIKKNKEAIAETIENNVRKLITDEMPTNPRYYQQMSVLLEELVMKRKQADLEYQKYLAEIIALSKKVIDPSESDQYPGKINTRGKQALFDNLDGVEERALSVHEAVMVSRSDDWRGHFLKERGIKIAIKKAIDDISDEELKEIIEIIKNQHEY